MASPAVRRARPVVGAGRERAVTAAAGGGRPAGTGNGHPLRRRCDCVVRLPAPVQALNHRDP